MSLMSEIDISAAYKAGARSEDRRHAFVAGCARSGTTALTRLLNRHPDICIGHERFAKLYKTGGLTPAHFEPERFLSVQDGDTHYDALSGFRAAHGAGIGAAKLVGDKIPRITDDFETLFAAFPGCKVVYILRDPFSVAESYERRAKDPQDGWAPTRGFLAAMQEWNDSLLRTKKELGRRPDQVGIFCFHDLLIAGTSLPRLYRFLEVDAPREDPLDEVITLSPPTDQNPMLRKAVAEHANFRIYRWLLDKADAQDKSFT
ncbi:MAG: sulfotransferase [Pseudomonadota bacterium]|jgi:hypothetical protein|uniref:Sulfotransferase n=1 Tax=Actibacterium naphthalenivorans TaxID=1614693 RepID=A0A840CCL1_9RHOB|nr:MULTISPECIES: sulfotransferase [Actibacterium]ALG89147.1 hypothetical protein TQ29_01895 [Actibacterium sp. EMB200-NS6]MBB4021278.1 hypothetical protein [Actibacterium naphthalenivorans]MDY6859580.1 sulfotransferase [Pseudomonadota bacterium]